MSHFLLRFRRFTESIPATVVAGVFIVAAVLLLGVHPTFAAAGDYSLSVTQELGSGLSGAEVRVVCNGYAYADMTDVGGGTYTATHAQMNSAQVDCVNGRNITFTVMKSGYITTVNSLNVYNEEANPDEGVVHDVQFSLKIHALSEDGVSLDNANSVSAGTNPTSCLFGTDGWYYCPVPAGQGNGITIIKSGFVTNTSGETGIITSSAQAISVVDTILYQLKVRVADELGNDVTANVITYDGMTPTNTVGSTYYFARTGSHAPLIVRRNGYIENESTNAGFNNVSTHSTGQTSIELGDYSTHSSSISSGSPILVKGLQYRLVSDILTTELGGTISGLEDTGIVESANGGASIVSSQVTIGNNGSNSMFGTMVVYNGHIYVSSGCNAGEGTCDLKITLSGVTADGGDSNAASFVSSHFTGDFAFFNGSQHTFGVGTDATVHDDMGDNAGFKYPLKVLLGDELGISGNDINASFLSQKTFHEVNANTSSGTTLYFANIATDASLILHAPGFVPQEVTNTSFAGNGETTGVTTTQDAQITITLGTASVSSGTSISTDTSLRGFQYVLKSAVLQTEIGGDVSHIEDFASSSGNLPDVTVSGANGVSILATVANGNSIYIAATGDGGGDDTVYVQLQNVSADGGIDDAANFVKATLVDAGNAIQTGTSVNGFAIGDGDNAIRTTGFRYPLVVSVNDELGNSVNIDTLLATPKYDGVDAYVSTGSFVYFANTATSGGLELGKVGFVSTATTNPGFSGDGVGITTNQDVRTAIRMAGLSDGGTINSTGVTPGQSDDGQFYLSVRGLEYAYSVSGITDEIHNALTPDSVLTGTEYGTSCTQRFDVWYCAVPVGQDTIIELIKNGFVTNTSNSFVPRSSDTDAQSSLSGIDSGMQYPIKVQSVRNELNQDVMPTSDHYDPGTGPFSFGADPENAYVCDVNGVNPGEGLDHVTLCKGADLFSQVYSAGAWYISGVDIAAQTGPLIASIPDYVIRSSVSDLFPVSGAQQTVTFGNGPESNYNESPIIFPLKVTVDDELGNAITDATATFFGQSAQHRVDTGFDTSGYYFSGYQSNAGLDVSRDGFVSLNTIVDTAFGHITTSDTVQTHIILSGETPHTGVIMPGQEDSFGSGYVTGSGLKYGLKVTVQEEGDNAAVTGSVIRVKDTNYHSTYDYVCSEYSGGVHYCAVPQRDDSGTNNIRISNADYSVKYLPYADRSYGSAPQRNITAVLTIPTDRDTAIPTVLSQYPVHGSDPVSPSVLPYVVFSKAMDPTTITGGSVVICESYGDGCIAEPTSATVSLSDGGQRATIIPTYALSENTLYMILVSTDVKDLAGNTLASSYGGSLTTFRTSTTTLAVTQISAVANTNGVVGAAIANGTFEDGFAWVFKVTLPQNEQDFNMKFSDFVSGSNTINASNIRFCSVQDNSAFNCSDAGHYHSIDSANTYSGSYFYTTSELSPATPGRQIEVRVEMKVPTGTAAGSYAGTYAVQSIVD